MGWADSFHLQINLFLLKIHGSMATVLLSFGSETMLIVNGKTILLLSLLLIFIQLGIVVGIFFDRLSVLSLKENALTSLVLLLTKISGP